MKIMHIEAGRHLYGGARQVLYLLQGLHARGVENILICPQGSAIATLAQPWAKVAELRLSGEFDVLSYRRLKHQMHTLRPDLVHIHSRRGVDIWGGLAAHRLGLPAILSRRVDNPEPRWLARWKYGLYARVIAISEGIRQVLLDEGVPPEHVVTVRSSLDPTPYLHPCPCEDFRAIFGLPDASITLAVIAQLIPRKGHRHLLRILPKIIAGYPQVRVLFFGQGAEQAALKQQVTELGLTAFVHFVGFREDLPRWLPCLDLVVHPAEMEGLGVSLLQASAAGVPIVATRAGGIPEAVSDGENGLLVPPASPQALGEAILKLLANPQERQALGEKGRAKILREFSVTHMVEQTMAVYAEVLGQGRVS